MKKIYLTLIAAFLLVTGSFAQLVVVAGADATTVAGSPYTSLKAAFDNINLASQTGNIIAITITGTTTETASASLNAGTWTSMTILPVGISSVTGNIAGPLLDLNGADNVTINGLDAGILSLTFDNTNTSATASTVRFISDATSNTIRQCNLLGASTGLGTVLFSTGAATGNSNNTIDQCLISSSAGGTSLNGIYALGSAGFENSSNSITANNIADYFSATAASSGINLGANNTAWTITSNKLYQTATRTTTAAGIVHTGIMVASGVSYNITGNTIGFANTTSTGTTNMIGLSTGSLGGTFPSAYTVGGTAANTRYIAINCAFTAAGAASSIQNNTIAGFAFYSSNGANTQNGVFCGIQVTSGNANIGTVTGNTIGAASGQGSIYVASTTAGAVVSGIYCTSANTINIQNNTIGGIDVSGTTATTAAGFKGIDVAGAGSHTISNNFIGNGTANNIRTGYLLTGANLSNTATTPTTATGTSVVTGILSSITGTTLNITGNTIRGLQVSGSATSFAGISNTGTVAGTNTISNNLVGTAGVAWANFVGASTGAIQGIVNSGGGAASTLLISNNSFQNINYTNAGASAFQCIQASANVLNETISGNSFINLTINTTAALNAGFLIGCSNTTPTVTVSNNQVVTRFANIASSGSNTYAVVNLGLPTTGTSNVTGNNLSNISVRTTGQTGGLVYQPGNTGTAHNYILSGNTVANLTNNNGTGVNYAIWADNGFQNTISNNTVSGISGGAQTIGIAGTLRNITGSPSITISGNQVSGITSSSATSNAQGINVAAAAGATSTIRIFKNKIYDINCTGAGTAIGIVQSHAIAGTTSSIYNNIIGRLYAPSSGFIQSVRGISLGSTVANTTNVYYNTVNIDGNIPFNSYCLYVASSTPTIDIRNNIFINNATATGSAEQMAVFRAGALTATYATTSNNNILYAGTPGTQHLLYAEGAPGALTNMQQTLAAFQAYVGPTRESLTKTENTPFINNFNGALANYLHINSNTTQAESGAANIATYTDDYDGNIRQGNIGYVGTGTAPDIGADEFEYISTIDMGAVTLVTPVANACRTTTETVTIRIANYGSVAINFSVNNVTVNASATGPNTYSSSIVLNSGTLAAGATMDVVMPATFDMTATGTYTFNANTVVAGDVDASNDAMSPVTRLNNTLGGTYTVGVAGVYPTLTAAVAAYNIANCFTSNVIFSLIDANYSTSETFPITINSNTAAGTNTLTIKPATGVVPTLIGSNATALIGLTGANYIIIDGDNGSGSKNFTINNTNTTGPVILFSNGASNNIVRNNVVRGATTSFGVITLGSTTAALNANSNNTIQNNDITQSTTLPALCIYNIGLTGKPNSNNVITGNRMMDFSAVAFIDGNGAGAGFSNNTQFSYNEIFQNATRTTALGGIQLNNAAGIVNMFIFKNNIHDLLTSNTGISFGIDLYDAASVNVNNNMISLATTTGAIRGIAQELGSGAVASVRYNTVSINGTTAGNTESYAYLKNFSSTGDLVLNNIFSNTRVSTGTGKQYGINVTTGSGVFSSSYNNLYSGGNANNVLGNFGGTDYPTLAGYQGASGETNSISVLPVFVSASNLHLLATANCGIDGKATPTGITQDIDDEARDAATPDIGADEFTPTLGTTLYSTLSTTTCDSRSVDPAGATFRSNACNPLARVVPSGGSPVTGTVNTCVYIDPATNPVFNAEPYVQRHFDIEPATGASTATATVTLYFTDAEFVTFNANNAAFPDLPTVAGGGNADPNVANVRITQYHGTPTTSPSSPGNYTVAGGAGVRINPASITTSYNGNYWEVTFPVTGFSGFYLHTNVNYALPITMNYFRGNRQGTNHLLNWKVTCNSTPRATLTLERSSSANGGFAAINTIDATAARCNQPFDYTDTRPLNGMNYYRVKMMDADGKVTYSSIVALLNATKGFEIVGIAPNPVVGGNFKLNVTSANAGRMDVVISDLQGRIVQRGNVTLSAGFSAIDMNVNNLASGTYNLVGITPEGKSATTRFVKSN